MRFTLGISSVRFGRPFGNGFTLYSDLENSVRVLFWPLP